MGPRGGRRLRAGGPGRLLGPRPSAGVAWLQARVAAPDRRGAQEGSARATQSRAAARPGPMRHSRAARAHTAARPAPRRRAPAARSRPARGAPAPRPPARQLAGPGRTHPPWLSSSGPEFLRVSPRRSHLSSGTGATWEWGTWGQTATSAGRWPWRRSGQPRAGRDAERAPGGRGGRGGTEAAAFQTEAELFQAFEAAHARLSLPSLPPSRRPPP